MIAEESFADPAQPGPGLLWLKGLLAAVIVLVALAGVSTAVVIVERQSTLEDSTRYGSSWRLSQTVNEFSRFIKSAAMFGAGADVTADEMRMRFEVLVGRYRMLSEGAIHRFIDADPERRNTLAALGAAIEEIDRLLADADAPRLDHRAIAGLAQIEGRLVGLASEAYRVEAERNADETRNLKRLHHLFTALSAGLIICGMGFVAIMLWQNHVIRTARDNLQRMAFDLQRTSVSHRFLDNIVNGMTEGLVVFDAQGRIGKINDPIERITGHGRRLLLGGSAEMLIGRPLPGGDLAAALASVSSIRRADGSDLQVRISTSQVVDATMEGATICVLQDLTEQRRADAEKAILREQLFDAQKMQAIGTLAGGIAHDFNNILGSILGYSYLALEDLPAGHRVRPALQQITGAGNRARDLVRQILAYSRNSVAELTPVELGPVLEASLATLRMSLPANVVLEVGATARVVVSGNAAQLDQVIANLCINAVHAIGAAPGRVRVAMDVIESDGQAMAGLAGFKGRLVSPPSREDRRTGEAAELWVGVLERRRYARIVVEDTGCGMSQATLARIFEPFFTTKEVGKGTGLGLAAVHGILRTHAGVMHVASVLGAWSRFELYLPESAAPSARTEADSTGADRRTAGGARVLVVDDDPALLELARLTLSRRGYAVSVFGYAREALAALEAAPRAWDLVVTDRAMPELDGETFAREVRRLRDDLPIIMVTGFVDSEDETRILSGGVEAIIFKPLVGPEFVGAVHDALERRRDKRLFA